MAVICTRAPEGCPAHAGGSKDGGEQAHKPSPAHLRTKKVSMAILKRIVITIISSIKPRRFREYAKSYANVFSVRIRLRVTAMSETTKLRVKIKQSNDSTD